MKLNWSTQTQSTKKLLEFQYTHTRFRTNRLNLVEEDGVLKLTGKVLKENILLIAAVSGTQTFVEDDGLLELTGKVMKDEVKLAASVQRGQNFVEIPIYPFTVCFIAVLCGRFFLPVYLVPFRKRLEICPYILHSGI